MNPRKCFSSFAIVLGSILSGSLTSCAEHQPASECSARNHELYRVRYYQESSSCAPDAGFLTGSLYGGTAGLETYMLVSADGKGGPKVSFRDEPGNLDRSATKFGLRLNALLTAQVRAPCDNNLANNCATPDSDFACKFCVVGSGAPGEAYTFADGTPAEDAPLADGGRQGVAKPVADGGTKRTSLANACVPGKKDDVKRESSPSPDPNLFLMLPQFGVKDICAPLDGGVAISTATFPAFTCVDGTSLEQVTVKTQLSEFRIVASARIPGTLAKGKLTFTESRSSGGSCTTIYQAVFLNPEVKCATDVDCSPVAVPAAPRCKSPTPASSDFCFTGQDRIPGTGASNLLASGLSPFLFPKLPDGGYDVRHTCDPEMKFCIWDVDAGL